ncbi:MAG TPA: hypothetical protein V6C97_11985 [Oculatellaceae cyanobacterium]
MRLLKAQQQLSHLGNGESTTVGLYDLEITKRSKIVTHETRYFKLRASVPTGLLQDVTRNLHQIFRLEVEESSQDG